MVMVYRYVEMSTFLLLFLLWIVALQGHGQPTSITDETPPPAQTCRIVLRGNNGSAAEGFTLVEFTLHCWSGDSGEASPVNASVLQDTRNNSSAITNAAVIVRFARSLLSYLNTDGVVPDLVGINDGWRTPAGGPDAPGQQSSKGPATTGLPPPSDSSSLDGSGNSDWGLNFLNVPHLKLVDTVISGLPLSSVGPLLQCLNCSFLTAINVTLQSLRAAPNSGGSSSVPYYGAFRATGLRGATLSHVQCSDVRGSVGWACILLQVRPAAAAVYIKDSSFVNNYVETNKDSLSALQLSRAMSPPPSYRQSEELPTYLSRCNINDYCTPGNPTSPGYGAVLIAYSVDENACNPGQPPPPAGGSASTISVEQTVFSSNWGGCGAGISVRTPFWEQGCYQAGNVYLTFTNSTITNNTADAYGGGIFFSGCSGDMLHLAITDQSTLSFNTARGGPGGGAVLYSDHMASMKLSGADVSYNEALKASSYNDPCGGGVYIEAQNDVSSTTVYGSNLSHNKAGSSGGAIYATSTNSGVLDIEIYGGSTLLGNSAEVSGGAVYVKCTSDTVTASLAVHGQSILSGNTAGDSGGAIALEDQYYYLSTTTSFELKINGSKFVDNHADYCGGAVFIKLGGYLTVDVTDGSTIALNTAYFRGGAMSLWAEKVERLRVGGASNISANVANFSGGAFDIIVWSYIEALQIVEGSLLLNNSATTGNGGGIEVFAPWGDGIRNMYVSDGSRLDNNTAGSDGGALCLQGPLAPISSGYLNMTWDGRSTLANNQAAGRGGGMYVSWGNVNINVLGGSQWSENTATIAGGALYMDAKYQDNSTHQVVIGESSEISRNRARNGGAIFINSSASLHVDGGSRLTSNAADDDGGALYLAQLPRDARLSSCDFSGNKASRGSGGGLYIAMASGLDCVQKSNISIWSTSFSGNIAGVADGGAIFLTSHETCGNSTKVELHVINSHFVNNTALGAGGAMAVRDDSNTIFAVAINRSEFYNNTAGGVTGNSDSYGNSGGAAVLVWREPLDPRSNLTASCQLKAEDTSFEANNCYGGTGGAVMLISCSSEFSRCNFTGNRAMLSGGAVGALHVWRSTATLGLATTSTTATTTTTNVSSGPQQGGLSMQRRRRLLANNTIIGWERVGGLPAEEKAARLPSESIPDAAGAIRGHRRKLGDGNIVCGSTDGSEAQWKVTLVNSTFVRNSAGLENGGALYLYASADSGRIDLANCTFVSNMAAQQLAGAALLAARGMDTNVHVTGSSFDGNSAGDSAGALYALVGSGACAAIANTTLLNNQAAVSGGACILDVRTNGSLLMQNSTAKDNRARKGDGGALQLHLQQGGRVAVIESKFTDNIAAGNGGAVLFDANCNSSLAVLDVNMSSNRADLSGGAMYVSYGFKLGRAAAESGAFGPAPAAINAVASPCTNMSIIHQRASVQGDFRNNTAGSSGGAVFLAPAGALAVFNSTMQSNVACGAGGSVAAENCSSLVMQYTVIADSRTLGSGGGFYAHGCRRLLLEYMDVTGNRAALSGGGIAISGVPDVSSSGSSNSGSADASEYTSLIFHRGQVSGNSATATRPDVDLLVDGCRSGVSSYPGQLQQQRKGLGGGIFMTGKVICVLNRIDLEHPNCASFGTSIATTQRCKSTNESSSPLSSYPKVVDPIEISAWDAYACWNRLETLASKQCWVLQMSDVLLPPVATNSSTSQGSGLDGSVGSGISSRQDRPIWVEDFLASALQVNCTLLTLDAVEMNATQYNVLRELLVSSRLNETIDNLINRTDSFGLQVLDMVAPNGTLPEAAVLARNSTGMPQKRFRRLMDQLVDCVSKANPKNVSLTIPELRRALEQQPYVGLPPSYMALQFSGEALHSTQLLQLQSGFQFNLAVQLYDMFHWKVSLDLGSSSITLAIKPLPPGGASSLLDAANGSAPWLDAEVANLIPGRDKSLEVAVIEGLAMWTGATVYAWPGLYSLLFSFKPGYTSQVNVAPLEMAVAVLPCRVGETLDLSRISNEIPWTGCKTCPSGQYGLWQDSRPNLTAIVPNSSAQGQDRYFQAMNDTLRKQSSSCHICSDNSLCLGGAVVVPKPGHWHSAANSTRIHECPNPTACNVEPIPSSDRDMLPGLDRRTGMLAWCQLEWYSSVVPGEAVQRMYYSGMPPQLQRNVSGIPVLLNGATLPSSVATGWQLPRCLVSGLPSGDPDSYMQQQCAEGYTGNLCASCVPNYYIDSGFNCKRCPRTARTIALGLITFFCSVLLVLFTTVTNFTDSFGRKETGEAEQEHRRTQPTDSEPRHRVEAGDVVKVIVLHLQYLIIVTRLSTDYPEVILRCQSVFSTITAADDYLFYSPSCLFRDVDSAGQALIQWLAGILTPCAVAVVSILLWTLRYTILAWKTMGHAVANTDAASADRAASLVPTPQGRADALPYTVLPTATTVAPVLELEDAESDCTLKITGAGDLARGGDTKKANGGGGSRQHHGRDPSTATGVPAAASLENQLDDLSDPPGRLRAGASIIPFSSPCYQGARDMYMLPVGIRIGSAPSGLTSGAEDTAFIPYYHRYPYVLRHRTTPRTLSHMGTAAIHNAIKRWKKLRARQVAVVHADKVMTLREQLGVVLMAAVFILYPSWAHAALSTFSCYPIDDKEGPFPEAQQATWKYGYWVRNMQAMCFSGIHLRVYVPVGIMAVGLFCLLPPLASFMFMWHVRRRLNDTHVRMVYGFLYKRYKPRFIWWEAVLQVETLILVSVEVLGRGLDVSYQALMLLAAFTVMSLVNVSCAPLLSRLLVIMEFLSLGTISLTITLSLYASIDTGLSSVVENCLAILIIIINTGLLGFFLCILSWHFWPVAAKKVALKAQAMLGKLSSIASTTASARHPKGNDMQGEAKQHQGQLACFLRLGCVSQCSRAPDGEALTSTGDAREGLSIRCLDDEFSSRMLLNAVDSNRLRAASTMNGMGIAQVNVSLEEQLGNTLMPGPLAPTMSHVYIQLDEIQ